MSKIQPLYRQQIDKKIDNTQKVTDTLEFYIPDQKIVSMDPRSTAAIEKQEIECESLNKEKKP